MGLARCETVTAIALLSALGAGCHRADPSQFFIERMDKAPVEQRPKSWDRTKSLMARTAPAVGEEAPDFTLPAVDGNQTITRSAHQGQQPLFLIFGSYT